MVWLNDSFSYQLQADSFNRSSFEHRALSCAALSDTTQDQHHSFRTDQFRAFSFQCSSVSFGLVQRGVQRRASPPASFANKSFEHSFDLDQLELSNQCLVQSFQQESLEAEDTLRTRACAQHLPSTRSSQTALATSSTRTTTRSLQKNLAFQCFGSASLVNIIFIGNSFWRKELVEHNELFANCFGTGA